MYQPTTAIEETSAALGNRRGKSDPKTAFFWRHFGARRSTLLGRRAPRPYWPLGPSAEHSRSSCSNSSSPVMRSSH